MFQSTHPRGVRLASLASYLPALVVSIHAPAWGATSEEGGSFAETLVSIHAPAWGATIVCRSLPDHFQSFNPRTRVGCDLLLILILSLPSRFQSTHPRGVRLKVFGKEIFVFKFQSTHPRGVRPQQPPGYLP